MNFSRFKVITFFGILILVSVVFLFLLKPFLYPILWAAIIAGMFYPVYTKINTRIKRTNLSSLATILIVFIIMIVPLFFVGRLVAKETNDLFKKLNDNRETIISITQQIFERIKDNPLTRGFNINEQVIREKIYETTTKLTEKLVPALSNLTQGSLIFFGMFIIMFYTLFFFLKDGEKLLRRLAHLSPLGEQHEEMMYKKFTSTSRAVLKGTLIVGAVQGFITGVLFYIVGIEGALIWGVITTVLSIIPGFGSYIIWLPAAIIMLILGNLWQAIVIAAIGGGVISTIDNFLRPILVGKDTQMHPLLILFSTLGGLVVFGISGFIIGPIITALFLSLWEMYEQYYRQNLDNDRA